MVKKQKGEWCYIVKKVSIFMAVVFMMILAIPVWAYDNLTGTEIKVMSVEKISDENLDLSEPFKDHRSLFKEARKRLLQAQSEIVKQANDAKSRVEHILIEYGELNVIKSVTSTDLDDLKRDLDKVKESQKIVSSIIKEVKMVLDQELDPKTNLNAPEFLQRLTGIYNEKSAQLEKEAENISKIAKPLNEDASEPAETASMPILPEENTMAAVVHK
jgi:septum formation inhibitor MinC